MFKCNSKVMGESVQVHYMVKGQDLYVLDILQNNRPMDIPFALDWVLKDVLRDYNNRSMVN